MTLSRLRIAAVRTAAFLPFFRTIEWEKRRFYILTSTQRMTGTRKNFAIIYTERGKTKKTSKNKKEIKTMEIGIHRFTVTFASKAAAENAKQIAADTLSTKSISGYAYDPFELFVSSLRVKGNALTSEEACLTADDFIEPTAATIKAIADNLRTENFTFDAFGEDTYAESSVEGCFKDGVLTITSTYYPCGYYEYIPCPECSEDVIRIENYEPNKTYVCPVCGEEVDLSEVYEDIAPVITKETIEVK